jgi:para-nitrobenzyl esterase
MRSSILGLNVLTISLASAISGVQSPPSGSLIENAPHVTVDTGSLQGKLYGNDVEMFLGIPYAAPPTGNLRWKPTVPAVKWSGVRQANSFGPICAQSEEAVRNINEQEKEYAQLYPVSGAVHADEDCLTLNIWTTNIAKTPRLPVMVYFHGGGMNVGSGVTTRLGPRLARKGVVLVTLNFRLGLLGSMAHPALTLESSHRASGNYGTLDQIAALQWIQRNIVQFGGDPQNVTIFGSSNGATQVCFLMISPLARRLFHQAIMQSEECRDAFLPELARRVDWTLAPDVVEIRRRISACSWLSI